MLTLVQIIASFFFPKNTRFNHKGKPGSQGHWCEHDHCWAVFKAGIEDEVVLKMLHNALPYTDIFFCLGICSLRQLSLLSVSLDQVFHTDTLGRVCLRVPCAAGPGLQFPADSELSPGCEIRAGQQQKLPAWVKWVACEELQISLLNLHNPYPGKAAEFGRRSH